MYNKMTKDELQAELMSRNIKYRTNDNKAEYIRMLKVDDGTAVNITRPNQMEDPECEPEVIPDGPMGTGDCSNCPKYRHPDKECEECWKAHHPPRGIHFGL